MVFFDFCELSDCIIGLSIVLLFINKLWLFAFTISTLESNVPLNGTTLAHLIIFLLKLCAVYVKFDTQNQLIMSGLIHVSYILF